MSTEILGIRLPKQKKQLFESVCLELNTTPSAVTRQLIEIYLKMLPSSFKSIGKKLEHWRILSKKFKTTQSTNKIIEGVLCC